MAERKLILFVDDEPDIVRLVIFRLKKAGYRVMTAETGEEALKLISRKPDLVLLDLRLPDIDGYEICRRIKADPNYKEIPVIFFTASANEPDKTFKHIKDIGAQGYIVKPYKWTEFLSKIKEYI